MRNVATYDANGVLVDDLKAVNFIYGSNGVGKSTLTKYLSNPSAIGYENCNVCWTNNTPIKTLVYNKEFRENNFSGDIDGVFTLGKATKDEIDNINVKIQSLKDLKLQKAGNIKTSEKLTEQLQKEKDEFKEKVWKSILKRYDVIFKDAFIGFQGSKENFKNKLLEENANNKAPLLDLEELKKNLRHYLVLLLENCQFSIILILIKF